MRLAVYALSAVLLSGCSWLGIGGQGGGYGQAGSGAYGVNCAPGGGHWQQSGYAYGGGAHCAPGGGYGVAGNGFGGAGYGAGGGMYGAGGTGYGMQGAGYGAGGAGYGMQGAGYGAGAAYGAGAGMVGAGLAANGVGGGMYGAGPYGAGAYGAGGVTTLGANAAYGSAVYGGNVVGTQYANGQYVQGAGVQTIQGAPYYVPQPYPAYYGVPQLRGSGGCFGGANCGGAMPWGFEAFGGTEFDIGGDVFGEKPLGPADEDPSTGIEVGAIDAISYDDAFGTGFNVGGALTYDVSRNTTLIGQLGYSKKNGQTLDDYTTVTPGAYAGGVFTPSGPARNLDAEFSDLEQWTLEGGVRQYVGFNPTFRPYVGASAGFARNNDVDLSQTYSDDGTVYNEQQFIESGWNPTAAATLGAEMAVGSRAALGVETGIRWRDGLDTNLESEDRWSIPVSLRGRVAF